MRVDLVVKFCVFIKIDFMLFHCEGKLEFVYYSIYFRSLHKKKSLVSKYVNANMDDKGNLAVLIFHSAPCNNFANGICKR